MKQRAVRTAFSLAIVASTTVLIAHAKASEQVWKNERNSNWHIELHLFPGGHFHSSEEYFGDMLKPIPNIYMDGTYRNVRRGVELSVEKQRTEFNRHSHDGVYPDRKRIFLALDGRSLIWAAGNPRRNDERLRRVGPRR